MEHAPLGAAHPRGDNPENTQVQEDLHGLLAGLLGLAFIAMFVAVAELPLHVQGVAISGVERGVHYLALTRTVCLLLAPLSAAGALGVLLRKKWSQVFVAVALVLFQAVILEFLTLLFGTQSLVSGPQSVAFPYIGVTLGMLASLALLVGAERKLFSKSISAVLS